AEKTGNRYGAAQTLNNLGVEYYHLQDSDQALACYERALRYWREIGNRVEESRTLSNLGLIHYQKRDLEKSLEFLKASLGDRVRGQYLATDASLLNNIGLIHLRRGQISRSAEEFQRALEWYQQALPLTRESGDRGMEVRVLSGLAEVHLKLDQVESARRDIDQAVAIADRIRTEISSPEHRVLSQPWMTMVYKNQVHVFMARHQQDPAAGLDTLALQASESYRLRTLLEVLSESRIELTRGIDAGYLDGLKELQLKLESVESRRAQSPNRSQPEKRAPLEREMDELLRQKLLLDAEIRASHPQYAALKMPAPLSPREIQRQLLDNETILLEYLLGVETSYLWLVTADSISSHRLPETSKIDHAVRRVQGLLASQNQPPDGETLKARHARQTQLKAEFDQAAKDLSQMLLGPVAGKLGNKRLLVIGDGLLQFIPFGVLPEPDSRSNSAAGAVKNPRSAIGKPQSYVPLIANHEIVTLPSASVLVTLRKIRAGRPAAPHALAVLADPVFNSEDERVRLNTLTRNNSGPNRDARHDSPIAASVRDVERSAAESGVQSFRRLHFSRQEAEAITGLLPLSERLQALDFAADRQLVLSGKLGEYRILHFATHGLLNNKTPALSGLVLSLVDEYGQPRNGFLRLHEIYNLKLNADLVVLSGCQTALGQEISGEGLIGLTRGFMYAGAPRVVASLWKVNDQATANLMKLFYKRMLNDGMRPAAALRAAQIAMWKAEPNAIPYRWGAFILQGDWR
ncbi:MAG: CHAT domain-containing tetratricopeptide repeat protein, partial [Acidobacteriota bacterium]